MSNLLKKVIILITQIPLWILEVLGFRSEMKEVTNNVKRKKLPKPKAKSRPKSGPKAAPLLVQEVGKAIYLWKDCGMTQKEACAEAGIGTNYLYKNMKKRPRRCENLRKKYAATVAQNKVAPIPKAETPKKVDHGKGWSRQLLSLEQMGRAVWLVEKCGWLMVDACRDADISTSTYARWRDRKGFDKTLEAYIKKVGKDKALEPNPRGIKDTKAAKPGKGVRGKKISKERLGRAIWLVEDCHWVVTHVAKETEVPYSTIWHCLKGRHSFTSKECKEAYLKKAGKDKTLELPPTIRNGGKGTWTTPEAWGEYMYLVHVKGWTKAKALKKFSLNYATVKSVEKSKPGYLQACLELYKEKKAKETKATKVVKEFQPTVASPSLKKAVEAPKKVSSVPKKAKVSVPTKSKVGNPSITTEMWGEVMYLHLVNKSPVRMACKAVGVKYSDYLQADPSHLDKCFKAYVDVPPKEKTSKKISSGSGKAIKLKAQAKSKGKVTIPKLTKAQIRRKLDLRPDAAWERLTEACLWQMMELLTPKQACKKARIEYSVYLEYKELNVTHNNESFRDMANEAEKHREASLLAKKEQERNKQA